MIETIALIGAGYAGYAGWDWRIAAVLGVVAGIWNFGVRAGGTPWLNERTPEAGRALINGTLISAALSAGLFCGIYFVVRWLAN